MSWSNKKYILITHHETTKIKDFLESEIFFFQILHCVNSNGCAYIIQF